MIDVRTLGPETTVLAEDDARRFVRWMCEPQAALPRADVRIRAGLGTIRVRSQVPISDRAWTELKADFSEPIMRMVAQALGRDVEELALAGDVDKSDVYLAQLAGWLKQAQTFHCGALNPTDQLRMALDTYIQHVGKVNERVQLLTSPTLEGTVRRWAQESFTQKGSMGGDFNVDADLDKLPLQYRQVEIVPVPLMPRRGTDPSRHSSILVCDPAELKLVIGPRIGMTLHRNERGHAYDELETATVYPADARAILKDEVLHTITVELDVQVGLDPRTVVALDVPERTWTVGEK